MDLIVPNDYYQYGIKGEELNYTQDAGRSFGAIGTPVPFSQDLQPPQHHPQHVQQARYQVQNTQPQLMQHLPHQSHTLNGAEIKERVDEEYFESDDDIDEKLSVNIAEMDRRLNPLNLNLLNLLLQKSTVATEVAEKNSYQARSTDRPSPDVIELDAAGMPIKESSDQWSKVAEKLKKAPSQVQEKLSTDKAPVIGIAIFNSLLDFNCTWRVLYFGHCPVCPNQTLLLDNF